MAFQCRFSLALVAIVALSCNKLTSRAFSVRSSLRFRRSTLVLLAAENNELSEAQRLLEKARQLKAEAEAEAQALHSTLLDQKQVKAKQLDKCIDALFPNNDYDVNALVARLKELKYSTDKLLEIITRLHEQEIKAKGIHQVEAFFQQEHSHTRFERISSEINEAQVERVSNMINALIAAAKQIDEEYLQIKRTSKNPNYLTHVEIEHWTVGECAAILSGKIRELRREHEEQFQERLHSFYEAQRKKDLPPPPEYMP